MSAGYVTMVIIKPPYLCDVPLCGNFRICRYDRQLIHLTRYDKINSAEPAKFSRAKALENNGPSATNAKKDSDLKPFKSNAYATSSHYSQNAVSKRKSGHNFDDGIIDDPTQLDTLIISDDEVHILNDLSRQTASDALDLKEESVVLSDSEFHQWILSRAKGGSADAAYALSKWFTPPSFTESSSCNKCQKDFGISRFRHHCRHCGKSFCSDHSSDLRTILKYGFLSPVRVCYYCACIIDKESRMDRQRWKKERLEDYSNKCMIPYFEIAEDRGVDKAFR